VVGVVQGNVPSGRVKNSENQKECHDMMDVKVEWSTQKVNR
jgi:hypothetical protein